MLHVVSKHAKVAQLVERNLAKVEVASSSLVFRSIFTDFTWRSKFLFLIKTQNSKKVYKNE